VNRARPWNSPLLGLHELRHNREGNSAPPQRRPTVRKLRLRFPGEARERAHKGDPARFWVGLYVSGQIPARHPLRHNLERDESYTDKRHDVDMIQSFPYHRLSVQHLLRSLENGERLTVA